MVCIPVESLLIIELCQVISLSLPRLMELFSSLQQSIHGVINVRSSKVALGMKTDDLLDCSVHRTTHVKDYRYALCFSNNTVV